MENSNFKWYMKIEDFIPLISTTDENTKIGAIRDILSYLYDNDYWPEVTDPQILRSFITNIISWLHDKDFVIAISGIDILEVIASKIGRDFESYTPIILQPVLDKLGLSMPNMAAFHILATMLRKESLKIRDLIEAIQSATHNKAELEEELELLLACILPKIEADDLPLLIPIYVRSLSHRREEIQQRAFQHISTIYKRFGEEFGNDLRQKYNVPEATMKLLEEEHNCYQIERLNL